ncbi:single-stranded DNA-binding protein [Oceanobacillus oncorhynchi]|uniref:single-stranded DNA-binding protein n=1 Tax=Oceanobacillus oncorhynchi TaxID=545501 RepID=UPI0018683E4F|nr:single-stranded DNA-binding protein [Oceanobacillus oncorhynchi]
MQSVREADFINCTAWGKQAKNLANYMNKGSQVGVTGRIQSRSYENNEGRHIFITEIVADQIAFLESKKQGGQPNQQNNQQQGDPFKNAGEPIDINDEDLPF